MNRSVPGEPQDAALPLNGRSIVVTRSAETAEELCEALGALGATTIVAPCIATEPPSDGGAALAAAVRHLEDYATVVLTSPTGARRFLAELDAADAQTNGVGRPTDRDQVAPNRGGSLPAGGAVMPAGIALAAIGPGTEAALSEGGLDVDLVADRAVAESLLEALGDPPSSGARLLLARAEVGRDVLPEGLSARGWAVDDAPAYRTVTPPPDPDLGAKVAQADAVAFTSSSTVTGFLSRFGIDAMPPVVACIGPISATTARNLGVDVDAEADPHTLPGLTAALIGCLGPA